MTTENQSRPRSTGADTLRSLFKNDSGVAIEIRQPVENMGVRGRPGEPAVVSELVPDYGGKTWTVVDYLPLIGLRLDDRELILGDYSLLELQLPGVIAEKVSRIKQEINLLRLLWQRWGSKGSAEEMKNYLSRVEELRELLHELFSNIVNPPKESIAARADLMTALLRALVFISRNPQRSLDDYDIPDPDYNLIAEVTTLFDESATPNLKDYFGKLAEYIEEQLQKSPSKPRDNLKKSLALYWKNSITLLSNCLDQMALSGESTSLYDAGGIMMQSAALCSNRFYAAAFLQNAESSLSDLEAAVSTQVVLKEEVEMPTTELEAFFYRVAESMGIDGRLPTEEEFAEWAMKKMHDTAHGDTREKIGYGDIVFRVGEEDVNLLSIWRRIRDEVPDSSELKKYMSSYEESIFPYGKMVFGSKRFREMALDNYRDMEGLYETYDRETRVDHDVLMVDIYRSPHVLKDAFVVPAIERWRASQAVYESLMQIFMIAEQKSSYFIDRFNSHNDYKLEARRYFGSPSLNNLQKETYSRAKLLTEQPNLGFLTIDEATYLLNNVGRLGPRELIPVDELEQSRLAIKLFVAAGPVQEDVSKSDEEKKYQALLDPNFKIVVEQKTPKYFYDGRPVVQGSHKLLNIRGSWKIMSGESASGGGGEDLFEVIQEMIEYGGRIEDCAYDTAYANLQLPQADILFKGFQKEPVWTLWTNIYAKRYRESNYSGTNPNFPFYRVLGTWPSQVIVQRREDSPAEESAMDVLTNPSISLEGDVSLWTTWTNSGEDERLADNLKRANDIMALMKDPDGKLGTSIDNLHSFTESSIDLPKIRKAFQDLRKMNKYWVDMFPGIESIDYLISPDEESEILDLARKSYREAVNLAEQARVESSEGNKEKLLKKAASERKRARSFIVAYLDQATLEWLISEHARSYADRNSNVRAQPNLEQRINLALSSLDYKHDLIQLRLLLESSQNGINSFLEKHKKTQDYRGWFSYDSNPAEVRQKRLLNLKAGRGVNAKLFDGPLGIILLSGVCKGLNRSYIQTEAPKTDFFAQVIKD